jgi:hypothetical protein
VDVLFDEEIDEEEPAERKGTWDSYPVTDLPNLYISTNQRVSTNSINQNDQFEDDELRSSTR